MADYHKAGLLTVRGGRVLLCRKKRTTSLLILPGGKACPLRRRAWAQGPEQPAAPV